MNWQRQDFGLMMGANKKLGDWKPNISTINTNRQNFQSLSSRTQNAKTLAQTQSALNFPSLLCKRESGTQNVESLGVGLVPVLEWASNFKAILDLFSDSKIMSIWSHSRNLVPIIGTQGEICCSFRQISHGQTLLSDSLDLGCPRFQTLISGTKKLYTSTKRVNMGWAFLISALGNGVEIKSHVYFIFYPFLMRRLK